MGQKELRAERKLDAKLWNTCDCPTIDEEDSVPALHIHDSFGEQVCSVMGKKGKKKKEEQKRSCAYLSQIGELAEKAAKQSGNQLCY